MTGSGKAADTEYVFYRFAIFRMLFLECEVTGNINFRNELEYALPLSKQLHSQHAIGGCVLRMFLVYGTVVIGKRQKCKNANDVFGELVINRFL